MSSSLILAVVVAVCLAPFHIAPHSRDGMAEEAPVRAIAGACKSVATFTSSAAPALRKDGCLGCHAGGETRATTAFDLTNVGKDDAAACVEALKKVNLATKQQSAIIQAAAGTLTHAGGKVSDAPVFTTAILGWINNE